MKKCDSYHLQPKLRYTYHPITERPIAHDIEVGVCWGTRECDECSCGGDRTKCDFYPEVRERAKKEDESFAKLKEIDNIKNELKYYLDTNEENGVVYIPKFIVEKIVYSK